LSRQTTYEAGWGSLATKVDDFKQLVKLRLNLMVVTSAVLSYFIAAGGWGNPKEVLALALGGFLVTGASNALNQVLEKDFDKMMKRTMNRPLPQGRMTTSQAVLNAGWMSVIGITLLAILNPWAGLLGAISLLLYAFIYTPIKRVSPVSVTIGAIPGALPALIGCVAFEGSISMLGLLLFGMMFFWQFPHFWAIAELGKEDYRKAGYKIISDDADANSLGIQSLKYATFLLPIIGGLFYYECIGIVNLVILSILTLIYMWLCYDFSLKQTRKSALSLMFSSFFYLPFFMGAMIVEQLFA
jgi:protoheme IX farnesyltransferase